MAAAYPPQAAYPPPSNEVNDEPAPPQQKQQQGGGDPPGDGGPMEKLQAVLDRFEITIAEANDLVVLGDYEICVIADDSGSMQLPAEQAETRRLGQPVRSRWDELRETVGEMVEIATCFDTTGVDVFFLNRPPLRGVTSTRDDRFGACFADAPRGSTPLTETLERVSNEFARGERKVLLLILTDGEPNGGKGGFSNAVRQAIQGGRMVVQVMACTPNEDEVAWLNDLDEELDGMDVTDDYNSEKAEVLRAGRVSKFTRGDWCMKAMLGPVSRKFDAWDEGGPKAPKGAKAPKGKASPPKAGGDGKQPCCCAVQ